MPFEKRKGFEMSERSYLILAVTTMATVAVIAVAYFVTRDSAAVNEEPLAFPSGERAQSELSMTDADVDFESLIEKSLECAGIINRATPLSDEIAANLTDESSLASLKGTSRDLDGAMIELDVCRTELDFAWDSLLRLNPEIRDLPNFAEVNGAYSAAMNEINTVIELWNEIRPNFVQVGLLD